MCIRCCEEKLQKHLKPTTGMRGNELLYYVIVVLQQEMLFASVLDVVHVARHYLKPLLHLTYYSRTDTLYPCLHNMIFLKFISILL